MSFRPSQLFYRERENTFEQRSAVEVPQKEPLLKLVRVGRQNTAIGMVAARNAMAILKAGIVKLRFLR